MPALLQEIVSVYPLLSPPNLTAHVSNRVCNALALLQCVASHPETRQLFLNGALHISKYRLMAFSRGGTAHIPLFLYPFLNTTSKTRPFEYLRLTSLGVIGALVKVCPPICPWQRTPYSYLVSKTTTIRSYTSFCRPKSFHSAYGSWRLVPNCPKQSPSSSYRRFSWTRQG